MKRAIIILAMAALFGADAAQADIYSYLDKYRKISNWAIAYDDAALGRVEGRATCDWEVRYCHVAMRDPKGGRLYKLEVRRDGIVLPTASDPRMTLVLQGEFPSGGKIAAPAEPANIIHGRPGWPASIEIGPKDSPSGVKNDSELKIMAVAASSNGEVIHTLQVEPNGTLDGKWSYHADPLVERDKNGMGPSGIFTTLHDPEQAKLGGFAGMQRGSATWSPLIPHIFGITIIEDQAGFDGQFPKYSHATNRRLGLPTTPNNTRTLVVIGRDLPMDQGKAVFEPVGRDASITYKVTAVAGDRNVSAADNAKFERAWAEQTAEMSAEDAAAYRKLDAVLLRATLTRAADPGPQTLYFGAASENWYLQYGDNTAMVHIVRQSDEQAVEIVPVLQLPEAVEVEVELGGDLVPDTIPVLVGGPALNGVVMKFIATRGPGTGGRYRTAPILLGGPGIPITNGAKVMAAIDVSQTKFIRTGMAEATAGGLSPLFVDYLKWAARCNKTSFNQADWANFARTPAETITHKRMSAQILYGDHAAMMLLRDAFTQMLRSQLSQLQLAETDDGLIDAWYNNMQYLVTEAPGFPLTKTDVPGANGGTTWFVYAYSDKYAEDNFHAHTTSEGGQRWRAWSRRASRVALAAYRHDLTESLTRAQNIDPCNREELLLLTGAGFGNVSRHIAPLLMKSFPGEPNGPDRLARDYTSNLNILATRIQSVEEFSTLVNKSVLIAATSVAGPAAGMIWGASVGAGTALAGGLVAFSYDSAHRIYDTYKGQQELRFAYSTVSILGASRYFDAHSKATPWWQTGLEIFGDAVMLGIGTGATYQELAELPEVVSLWRGERIFSRVKAGTLSTFKKLSARDQRDVAVYILKNQEQIAAGFASGPAEGYVARVFDTLGAEANKARFPEDWRIAETWITAKPPSSAMGDWRELETQAMNRVDDFKAAEAPVDPLRSMKTEISEENLARDAKTELSDSAVYDFDEEMLGREAAVVADASMEGIVPRAIVAQKGMPLPNTKFATMIEGKRVVFDVGKVLSDSSAFFDVYELKSLPLGLKLEEGLGEDLVLKVLKKNTPPGMQGSSGEVAGIRDHVVQRMLKMQTQLENAKIPSLKIQGWDEAGIILQKRYIKEPGKFELFSAVDDATWSATRARFKAEPELQQAVANLFSELRRKDLIWLDCHIGNIYFEKAGEKWVAGVLDQDFIGTLEGLADDAAMRSWGLKVQFEGAATGTGMPINYTTVKDYWERMLVNKGWLKYYRDVQVLDSGLTDLKYFQEAMRDMSFTVPKSATPAIVPPRIVPPRQGLLGPLPKHANDDHVIHLKMAG